MRRLRSFPGWARRSMARWGIRIIGPIVRLLLSAYRSLTGRFDGLSAQIAALIPALIAGAGVFLVVAGLFNYLQPAAASAGGEATTPPAVSSFDLPTTTLAPSASATAVAAIATRVRVRAVNIDLPVVSTPPGGFPLCNAAEYYTIDSRVLAYPGLPQATYLFAHARKGMFGPLLDAEKANNLSSLMGMWVEVYTADNRDHVYQITETLPGVSGTTWLDRAAAVTHDELWPQTSEGPYASSTKLQVVAEPIGVLAASYSDAHPASKGNVCPEQVTP